MYLQIHYLNLQLSNENVLRLCSFYNNHSVQFLGYHRSILNLEVAIGYILSFHYSRLMGGKFGYIILKETLACIAKVPSPSPLFILGRII